MDSKVPLESVKSKSPTSTADWTVQFVWKIDDFPGPHETHRPCLVNFKRQTFELM